MKRKHAAVFDYLNGHLTERAHCDFEARLENDAALRDLVSEVRLEMGLLRSAMVGSQREEAMRGLYPKMLAVFRQGSVPRRRLPTSWRFLLASAAIALILLGVGASLGKKTATDSSLATASLVSGQTINLVLETDDPQIKIYWTFEGDAAAKAKRGRL